MWRYVLATFASLVPVVACSAIEVDPFTADCRGWCSKRGDCGVVVDTDEVVERCADSCVDAMELDAPKLGQQCVGSFERAMSCLAEISCEEYTALLGGPDVRLPCAETLDSFYKQCPGVFIAPEASSQENP